MDKTPTFRHVQGGVRMVATGYVLIKVDIVRGVVACVSRDTTEDSKFLLVNFKDTNIFRL